MPRDQRWPLAWTVVLMSIHLAVAIALLGLGASDLSNLYNIVYTWSYWIVPQCCIVIIATIIHIVCVCTAKLNPGWTLSFYLIMWLAWVALAAVSGITYSFWDLGYDSGGYYWDGYEYVYDSYYDYSYNLLTIPKVIAELALISVCAVSGLAIWIFCCVIVNRWRRERNILIQRGSQMPIQPIQYVNVQTGQFLGQYPGPPFDPQKIPYPTQYVVPLSEQNVVQYPHPTRSPPQNYAQYPPPTQSPPVHVSDHYAPPERSPIQEQVQYPSPVQSPVPIRKPISGVQSDEYPTFHDRQNP